MLVVLFVRIFPQLSCFQIFEQYPNYGWALYNIGQFLSDADPTSARKSYTTFLNTWKYADADDIMVCLLRMFKILKTHHPL